MKSALAYFIEAVIAYSEKSVEAAVRLTEQAALADPKSLFFQQARLFLNSASRNSGFNVYTTPLGFEKFIRGGGNIKLYQKTSTQLKKNYDHIGPLTLLDIGVGDGHALLPALSPQVEKIDLIEPSTAMLKIVTNELKQRSIPYQAYPMTWQHFCHQATAQRQWDVIQMTFSAHTFSPDDRARLFRWAAERCKHLLIAEFDVPLFSEMLTPEVIGYYVSKYELGVTEYAAEAVVIQQFLLPLFFGNFIPHRKRVTYEQTAGKWQTDLENAGFSNLQKIAIFDYWWAPAFMLHAKGQG